MNTNVVSFTNYKAISKPVDAVKKQVEPGESGAARLARLRAKHVRELIAKVRQGDGALTGPLGRRYNIKEGSPFGFDFSDDWRNYASLREGSPEHLESQGRSTGNSAQAHYPLLATTIYFVYTHAHGMFFSEGFVYQSSEVVPSLSIKLWSDDMRKALSATNAVTNLYLEVILTDLKSKYNMEIVTFQDAKNIQFRSAIGRHATRSSD